MKQYIIFLLLILAIGCQSEADKHKLCSNECISNGWEFGQWSGLSYCICFNETITIEIPSNETIPLFDNSTLQCPTCQVCTTTQCPACPTCIVNDCATEKETITKLQIALAICDEQHIRNWTLYECESEIEVLEGYYNDSLNTLKEIYLLAEE